MMWRERILWGIVFFVLGLFWLGAWVVSARDLDGRYSQSPLREWFDSLRSEGGAWCCYESDGTRLYDPDWEQTSTGFKVRIFGQWYDVPPSAVIKTRNRAGYPVVWQVSDEKGNISVKCFLPGTQT